MTPSPRLAIFCGPLNGNSTAKIAVRLANAFVASGSPTDLLVTPTPNPVAEPLSPGVDLVDLGPLRVLTRVGRMARYLRERRPAAVLTHRVRDDVLTLKARRRSGTDTRVFVTVHGPLSVKIEHQRWARRLRRRREVLHWYPRNQGIVAISEETAHDLRGLLGPQIEICTIPNPVVVPELFELAGQSPRHPWLVGERVPVVVYAGRLEAEKDVSNLLQAVECLVRNREIRLVILGEGRLRPELEAERARLGLDDCVDMPGWATNPYPYLRAADLVVLSSYWDALPTVLIEALALGTPVVSTACGAGPVEVLDHGRYGLLVPPREPEALAAAMAQTLDHPLPSSLLRQGGERYEAQRNADRYRALMLGEPAPLPET